MGRYGTPKTFQGKILSDASWWARWRRNARRRPVRLSSENEHFCKIGKGKRSPDLDVSDRAATIMVDDLWAQLSAHSGAAEKSAPNARRQLLLPRGTPLPPSAALFPPSSASWAASTSFLKDGRRSPYQSFCDSPRLWLGILLQCSWENQDVPVRVLFGTSVRLRALSTCQVVQTRCVPSSASYRPGWEIRL